MKAGGNRRDRGAYYTPTWLARSLAAWSIRSAEDVVIDPAAGRGELLLAAAEELRKRGGTARGKVFGVELHENTVRRLRERLVVHASARELLGGDFFTVANTLPKCHVVIANPPYVRHQEIPYRAGRRMRAALDGCGDAVSGKASAWAYFLAYAPALLRLHGRMAFVLPAEVLTSDYAGPLAQYLAHQFQAVRFVYCDGDVFPGLGQQTVLCLLEDYHRGRAQGTPVRWSRLAVDSFTGNVKAPRLDRLACAEVPPGAGLVQLLAPAGVAEVEHDIARLERVVRLGDVAAISIGYVTGSNGFFHMSEPARKMAAIDSRHLTKVVARSRLATGIEFTEHDWASLRASGAPCWLLTPQNTKDSSVRRLLAGARRRRVHKAYKCRSRPSWWKVPLREAPPAFMCYMGSMPVVKANAAEVLVSNSLFEVRGLHEESAVGLAVASMTSVFQLSAIMNSRLIGGGLRKLEPSDARRVLLPLASPSRPQIERIDELVRRGRMVEARKAADTEILVKTLGWSREYVSKIQTVLDTAGEAGLY